jgi:hypothetical protein
MTWEYDQWWCDCDGATSLVTDEPADKLECVECGKVWRRDGDSGDWETIEREAV